MEMNLAREVVALRRMTPNELREKYAAVYGAATVTRNRTWLVRRIAWRLQALAEGDLSQRAQARAVQLARDADVRVIPPRETSAPAPAVGSMRTGAGPRAAGDDRLPRPVRGFATAGRFFETWRCTRIPVVATRRRVAPSTAAASPNSRPTPHRPARAPVPPLAHLRGTHRLEDVGRDSLLTYFWYTETGARVAGPLIFTREDWTEFRDPARISAKAGVSRDMLPRLVVKELADNALDASEGVLFGLLTVDTDTADDDVLRFFVSDDGTGLPGTDQEIATHFSIRRPLTSSKTRRRPTRGMLGNGLRAVAGWPATWAGCPDRASPLTTPDRHPAPSARQEPDGAVEHS